MKGVERVFHVAGTTSMRGSDRERVFEVNVGGTRNVMEEALRAGVDAGGAHLQRRRGGPGASPAAPPTSPSPSPPGGSGSPT